MHLKEAEGLRRRLPELIGNKRTGTDILNRDLAYLCPRQVLSKKDRNETGEIPCAPALLGFLPDENTPELAPQRPTIQTVLGETPITAMMVPTLLRIDESSHLPAGKRWRGKLGPSMFMTAVETAPPSPGMREHGETVGRRSMRLLGMTEEQRHRNGLPPHVRAHPDGFAGRRELARLYAAGAAAVTALVQGANSAHEESTHGWKGLTTNGKRCIRDAGAVLDEEYGTLGFFTVTLTDETAMVANRAQVADFQSRLLYTIRRELERLGLPPMVLIVAEMHPNRWIPDNSPIPHWHGIVKLSHRPYDDWIFRKENFNHAVLQAYEMAFGHKRGHTQRLQLLPQKTGCAKYLSPYMSKGGSDVEALRGTWQGRMVPSQWWTWTGELRLLVTACRTRPPAAFLRWCVRWRGELAHLGEAKTGDIRIGDDLRQDQKETDKRPIIGCWFAWRSEAALDRAIRAWIEEELTLMDRATAPPDPHGGADGWVDEDGVVRYGFDPEMLKDPNPKRVSCKTQVEQLPLLGS
jgi:hypothetical protein